MDSAARHKTTRGTDGVDFLYACMKNEVFTRYELFQRTH